MAAPAGAILGEAARQKGGVVSRPLRAPKRFNLVGLSWRGREREAGIAVRARARWRALDPVDAAGSRSRWTGPTPAWRRDRAPPVQPDLGRRGGLGAVPHRASGCPGLRLRFVNIRGHGDGGRPRAHRVCGAP